VTTKLKTLKEMRRHWVQERNWAVSHHDQEGKRFADARIAHLNNQIAKKEQYNAER